MSRPHKHPKQKKLLRLTECNPYIHIEYEGQILSGRKKALLKLKKEINRKYDDIPVIIHVGGIEGLKWWNELIDKNPNVFPK